MNAFLVLPHRLFLVAVSVAATCPEAEQHSRQEYITSEPEPPLGAFYGGITVQVRGWGFDLPDANAGNYLASMDCEADGTGQCSGADAPICISLSCVSHSSFVVLMVPWLLLGPKYHTMSATQDGHLGLTIPSCSCDLAQDGLLWSTLTVSGCPGHDCHAIE